VTVEEYEQALKSNLQRLHERVHSGQYWPKPVRRTYIPKSDGGRRLLGFVRISGSLWLVYPTPAACQKSVSRQRRSSA
jgi:RNA-directed DNA polymerase